MKLIMCFPEGKNKAFTMSYDDGIHDERLIAEMKKYGVKGTVNLCSSFFPGGSDAKSDSDTAKKIRELYDENFVEIAVHTEYHPNLNEYSPELVTAELLRDRTNLERLSGRIVRGFAYPYGKYGDSIDNSIRACGIAYARTAESSMNFELPLNPLRYTMTCHHSCEEIFDLIEDFCAPFSRQEFKPVKVFGVWGHSHDFDRDNNWDRLPKILEAVSGKDDVWYATCIEIFDYVAAYKTLQFNIDRTMVHNPSAIDVWFEKDKKLYKVCAGETLSI